MPKIVPLLGALLIAGCTVTTTGPSAPTSSPSSTAQQASSASTRQLARSFAAVVQTVEPVAERECARRTSNLNCDFRIVVDDRPGQPANAYQTLDKSGRPLIVFTLGLIRDARNRDELAFVLGHEAAHHIAGHLGRQQQAATLGAVIFGGLATLGGAGSGGAETAQRVGAAVGARTFSKEFELEADRLGTIITARAGYDPVRGAEFFTRIPDPGDRFLGSHPPNADRIATVRRTAAQIQ